MILRYTRKEMGSIFSPDARFKFMLDVERAVAEAQGELKIIPIQAAEDILKKSKFSVGRIQKLEEKTRHDVIAFVSNVAESVGPNGKFVHYGLTSSDVLDTALNLQIVSAHRILSKSIQALKKAFKEKIREHKKTLCAGRTHGIHAEPTTFGLKLAGFYAELKRNEDRLETAVAAASVVKLSGAVGTYSSLGSEVEKKVAEKLNFMTETVATQVIPRDRHAEVILSLALLGAGLERFAIELRHLQRTEVSEVEEGFAKGQKGSSAMPHKKNPISAENITGIARLLRSYAQPALENVALWHERDISHSSVERVILPDAFILADYAIARMTDLLKGLVVNKKRMLENMALSKGQLFSSQLLLALVKKGLSREDAYKHVQSLSHSLKNGENLESKALKHKVIKKYLKQTEIKKAFSGNLEAVGKILESIVRS